MSIYNHKKQKSAFTLIAYSIIFLILLSGSFIYYFFESEEDNATVINLAGRQRMLSQRITKNLIKNDSVSQLKTNNQLNADLNSFKIVHYALQNGSDSISINESKSENVIELFNNMEPFYIGLTGIADSAINFNKKFELDRLSYMESNFIKLMDNIVFTMNEEADQRADIFIRIITAIFIFAILIIGFELYFLVYPSLVETKKYYDESINSNLLLEEENETKLSVLRNFNHEFNSPLNVISGNIQILEAMEAYEQESVDDIKNNLDKINLKLKKINTFTKLQTNPPSNKDSISLSATIDNVIEKFNKDITAKGLIINNSIGESANVEFNSEVLNSFLEEIIENSVKYTDEGQINISSELLEDNIKLIIEDTGVGMDNDYIMKSTLFSQADKTHSRKYDGLGLGLSIIKSISTFYSLGLDYKSEKSKGTKVSILF